MRVILVNQRYGHTQTYVIKGWLKGLLSLCLLGAPVALGYLGYQLSVEQGEHVYAQQHASSHTAPLASATDTASGTSAGSTDGHGIAAPELTVEDTLSTPWTVSLARITPLQQPRPVATTVRTFRHGRIMDPATYLARIGH